MFIYTSAGQKFRSFSQESEKCGRAGQKPKTKVVRRGLEHSRYGGVDYAFRGVDIFPHGVDFQLRRSICFHPNDNNDNNDNDNKHATTTTTTTTTNHNDNDNNMIITIIIIIGCVSPTGNGWRRLLRRLTYVMLITGNSEVSSARCHEKHTLDRILGG